MNTDPNNPDQGLEALLRQWGADEAIRNVSVPPPPQIAGQGGGNWLLRWGPMLAAAMLLASAGVLFYGAYYSSQHQGQQAVAIGQPDDKQGQVQDSQIVTRLDRLEKRFAMDQSKDGKESRADGKERFRARGVGSAAIAPGAATPAGWKGGEAKRLGAGTLADSGGPRADMMPSKLDRQEPAALAAIEQELEKHQARLSKVEAQNLNQEQIRQALEQTLSELKEKSAELASLKSDKQTLARKNLQLSKDVADSLAKQRELDRKLNGLGAQLALLEEAQKVAARDEKKSRASWAAPVTSESTTQTASSDAAGDQADMKSKDTTAKLQDEIDEMKAKLAQVQQAHSRLRSSFEMTYRSSLAPGQTGLDAWRTIVTRARLISRSRQALQDSSNQATRKLVEQVEFILTRLSLAPRDAENTAADVAKLIQQRKLVELIDQTLQQGKEIPRLNAFLLESRTVLKGIVDVG